MFKNENTEARPNQFRYIYFSYFVLSVHWHWEEWLRHVTSAC